MITKEDIILSRFRHATRPHDPALNTVQLNQLFGVPPKKVSPMNVKELKRRFVEVHYMCGGMHKRYEW
jgi:hypothetical protein